MASLVIALNPRNGRRGGIVSVRPDGHQFARLVTLNPPGDVHGFAKIHFPGVTVQRVRRFLGRIRGGARYRWRVVLDELPRAAKRKLLENDGEVTVGSGRDADFSWSQVRGFFEDQLDGSRESGDL